MTKIFVPDIPKPGTQSWPFRLGDVVQDKFNPSIKGILVSRTYHLSGCDTFNVDLMVDPTAPYSALNKRTIDDYPGTRLELLESHPERHREEVPPPTINLGDRVKDYTTELVGRVTHIQVILSYEAPQALLVPTAIGGKVRGGKWADFHMLEVLESYDDLRKRAEAKPETHKQGEKVSAAGRGCTIPGVKSSVTAA